MNYDSNVFREKEARHDFYYETGGTLIFDATNLYKELGAELSYRGFWTQYFSFSKLNHYEQEFGINFPGPGKRLRIGKKITVAARAGISASQNNRVTSQDQNLFAKNVYPFLSVNADYLISKKFSTDFTYNFSLRRTGATAHTSSGTVAINAQPGSTSGNEVTVQEHGFFHRLKYHLTPKTFTFVGFGYGFTSGSGDSQAFDSNFQRISGGIEGKITSKSVASVEVGTQRRYFKADENTSWSLYTQAAYLVQFTKKWAGRILVLRDTQASLSESTGLYTTTAVSVGVAYKPAQKWLLHLDPYFRWNEVEEESITTTTTTGTTTTTTTTASGGDNYTFGFDSGIRYYVKRWLSLYTAYRFEVRTAKNDESGEYTAHLGTVGVNIGPLSTWKG
jgi:hypothetical protein